MRFLIAGGTGTVFNLAILYALVDGLAVWYLAATTIAFIIGSVFSFTLQRFFTFQKSEKEGLRKEFPLYLSVGTVNLILNGIFMYTLVDILHIWYLASQLIATGVISIESYFMYRIIFKKS